MARMRVEGMDAVIEDMIRMGQQVGPVADKMLMAGAEVAKEAWKHSIQKHDLIDKHDMIKSVGFPRQPKTVNDVRSIDVYPQGKDRKGIRNAEKAFVLHYGRNNMDPTYFVDEAERESNEAAEKVMTDIWNDFIEKGS